MEKYSLYNQVEKVLRGENTSFLNPIDTNYVVNRIKNMVGEYHVFRLFDDAEKLIVYQDRLDITLFEIVTNNELTHKEILGSLFSHNLSEEVFGDIIISDRYYIVIVNKIKNYIINNFNKIGNKNIKLKEADLDTVSSFAPKFMDLNISVSSLRIDNIISKIIPTSRSISYEYIKDNKVVVNYQLLKNKNYSLKKNDVFSIRGIGKFRFVNISKITKNSKYNILIKKYM